VKSSTHSTPSDGAPRFNSQKAVSSTPADLGQINSASGMMRGLRKWLVNGFILGTLGLTAVSIGIKKEEWPICNYPMFDSLNRRADTQNVEIYVVSGAKETPLRLEYGAWHGTYGLLRNVTLDEAIVVILDQKSWHSQDCKAFLALILRELKRKWNAERKSPEPPRSLRVYTVNYHYPELGDYRPQVLNKTLMLEVNETTL